jgi:hypothetical protein
MTSPVHRIMSSSYASAVGLALKDIHLFNVMYLRASAMFLVLILKSLKNHYPTIPFINFPTVVLMLLIVECGLLALTRGRSSSATFWFGHEDLKSSEDLFLSMRCLAPFQTLALELLICPSPISKVALQLSIKPAMLSPHNQSSLHPFPP